MWFIPVVGLFFLLSCSANTEQLKSNEKIVEGILTCQKVDTPIKPAVCGKCRIKYEGDKLYIIQAEDCPTYEVYRCKSKNGKNFSINNLSCKPEGDQ